MLNKHLLRLHPLCSQMGDWSRQPCYFYPAFSITGSSEAKGSKGFYHWSCQHGYVGDSCLACVKDNIAEASLLSLPDRAELQPVQ